MSIYTYTYPFTSFPHGIIAKDTLYSEVQNSSITAALQSIDNDLVNVYFNFKASLSAGEITTLNTLVSNHQGISSTDTITVIQGISGSVPWNVLIPSSSTTYISQQTGSILHISGTVHVDNPVNTISVLNFPTTQSVIVDNSLLPVSLSNRPTIDIGNFPVTQNVLLVSGASAIGFNNPLWITGSVVIGAQPVTTKDYEVATFSVLALDTVIGNEKSMISIVNASGSGVIIKIRSIKIINTRTTAVTGIVSDFRVVRITGHSVGTLLSPQTFDTAASLNANVTIRTDATVTGASTTPLLRHKWSSDEYGPGTLDKEGLDQAFQNTIPIYQHFPGRKPITLHQGEGLHILHNTNSTAGSFDIDVIFTQE